MAQENSRESESRSNSRRCGQIGEGEEDHVSMLDVLREEEQLQADADAVLGGSDEYNCTYPKGYLPRQALYACATCTPEGNAGFCLACSYACHEGHEIYELYTKRNFKCDCGNEKFKDNPCQLYKEHKELNSRNRYNQNFRGLYCTCSRPYPDDENPVEDEMIQCVICEDWFHGLHLSTEVPDNSDYHEMICTGCMCRHSFLWAYYVTCAVTPILKSEPAEADQSISVGTTPSKLPEPSGSTERKVQGTSQDLSSATSSLNQNCKQEACGSTSTSPAVNQPEKRKADCDEKEEYPHKKQKTEPPGDGSVWKRSLQSEELEKGQCFLESLQQRVVEQPDHAAFWSEGWRAKLCRCDSCMDMYQDKAIEFLLDESDTMQAYEAKGIEAAREAKEQEASESEAFASMGRVQQIEIVRGVMDLKTELNQFLQGFAREGKVIKESDIREFFQMMDQRRRDRTQPPQHNCR